MIDDNTCYRCPRMKYHEGPCETKPAPMNSDHAPTAEEQLPPLPEWKTNKDIPADVWDEAVMFDADAPVSEWLVITRRQLLAALRENREDKLHIRTLETIADSVNAELEGILGPANGKSIVQVVKDFQAQLAKKDARIAELESDKVRIFGMCSDYRAKLHAISEALQETERADAYCPACGNSRLEGHVTNCFDNDWVLSEPEDIFARIRAIVEGK